jgi:DNA (cytosine-5)-methyltransferase 1
MGRRDWETETFIPTIGCVFDEVAHTLKAEGFDASEDGTGRGDMGEIVNALNAQSGETGKGDAAPCVAYNITGSDPTVRTGGYETETHVTLRARAPGTSEGSTTTVLHQHMAVRRLTPVECERLQGFPDGYTNIPWRNKPEAPDGPRYKALGNSMAVPVMAWIGRRIAERLQ